MKCIYCNHKETSVNNSRTTKGKSIVWRRRFCEKCDSVFTTREDSLSDNLFLLKRNGKRQRFVYEKLFVSIFTILSSGKQGDNGDKALLAKVLTYQVIHTIRMSKEITVPTSQVVRVVYSNLYAVNCHDAESYIFYSPYRQEVVKAMRLQHNKK